jgi:hypothetical protein
MHRPSAATSGEFAVDLQQKVKAARLLMADTLRARMGPENELAPATELHKMLFENEARQLGLSSGGYAAALRGEGYYIDASGVQELAIELNTNIVVLSYLGNSLWTHSVFITSGDYPEADLSLASMVARPDHYILLVRTHSHRDTSDRSAHYDLLIPGDKFNKVLHTTSAPSRSARSELQSIKDRLDEEVIPHSSPVMHACYITVEI